MYSTFLVAYLFLSWKRTTKHIISRNSMAKLRRRWLFKYRESTLMKSSYPYKRVSFLSEWSHKIPMVASKLNSGNNIQVTEQLYQYMHNRNCGFCCFFLLLFFLSFLPFFSSPPSPYHIFDFPELMAQMILRVGLRGQSMKVLGSKSHQLKTVVVFPWSTKLSPLQRNIKTCLLKTSSYYLILAHKNSYQFILTILLLLFLSLKPISKFSSSST